LNPRELLFRAWNALEELHVHLQPVAGLRLLVALPALSMRLMLLVRRKAPETVLLEDVLHRRSRDADAVKALEVIANLACAEVIVLAQVEHLRHNRAWRRVGRAMWLS
jgi:hypothetical protein